MNQLFIYVFAIFLIHCQNECFGKITNPRQYEYDYKGHIETGSSACNKSLARWTVSGNLIIQNSDELIIFQLEDVKTSVFNGESENLKHVEETPIPDEAQILLKPFVAHKNNENYTIGVTPNEPIWSINMKRSIANQFQIKLYEIVKKKILNWNESSIYGDCNVDYSLETVDDDNIIVIRTIHHETCNNIPLIHKSNVERAPATKHFNPTQIETVRSYLVKDIDDDIILANIFSNSSITYKSMPSIPSTQYVHQSQEFKLQKHFNNFNKTINIDDNTEIIDPNLYEFEDESFFRKPKQNINDDELVNDFFNSYEQFNKNFETFPLKNFNIREEDNVLNMFLSLANMKNGIPYLNDMLQSEKDYSLFITAFSMWPYIGNNYTTKYISDILEWDLDFSTMEYEGFRLFAIFPKYIDYPTEDLIKSLEFMLNLNNIQYVPVRNAGIMSFASVIANSIKKNLISSKKLEEYQNLFYNKFLHEDDYEQKMIYLLCLVNIAEGLTPDFIIPILTNTFESKHLRSLGITGFKSRLITFPEKVYTNFWPIFTNETEPFEIRVASLDLLMSTHLSEEQFNSIVKVCNKPQQDIHNKHLSNYFYTTILSLQNLTHYSDPLGPLASALLEKEHFPEFIKNSDAWTTSNYRVSYTDNEPNFGRSFQARLIANPITNKFSTIQFTYNQFFMSFDIGTYSVYLNLDQVIETMYKKRILEKLSKEDITVPKLLKLLEECSFEMKKEGVDFHAEVVIFVNNTAIAAFHIYPGNVQQFRNFVLMTMFSSKVEKHISYPLMDHTIIPSDFGTPIKILHDIQEITACSQPEIFLLMRHHWSLQTKILSYNPLANTTISTFKYYGQERSFNVSFDLLFEHYSLSFIHQNNSVECVWDKLIGTAVEDENILKKYCQNCDAFYEIPMDIISSNIKTYDKLGIKYNYTVVKHVSFQNTSDAFIISFLKSHHSNENTFPLAKPLLFYWYLEDYLFYMRELRKESYRSISYYPEATQGLFKLNFGDNINPNPLYAINSQNISIKYATSQWKSDNVQSLVEVTFIDQTFIKPLEENNGSKIIRTHSLDVDIVKYNDSRVKINVNRELELPALNSDKFSITPKSPVIGNTMIHVCDFTEYDDECYLNENNVLLLLKEKYWTSDERIETIKSSKSYEQCKIQSRGLKYTPLTEECILNTYLPINKYDKYEMYAEYLNDTVFDTTDIKEFPVFTCNLIGDDKLQLFFLKSVLIGESDSLNKYFNYSLYYPYMLINPNKVAYNNYEISSGNKRSCFVNPKIVKTLTGDLFPFNEKESVAMVECYHKPLRGLTIQKIDEKHIGFKFWFYKNKLTATINGDKLEVKLNGNVIKNTYKEEENNFSISFLDKNVIYIIEEEMQIYYNTEYIDIEVLSIYNTRLCGFCSHDD